MKIILTFLFMLIAPVLFAAGPKWRSVSRVSEPAIASIAIAEEGGEEFTAMVEGLLKKGLSIRHVYLARIWTEDSDIQGQLQAIVRHNAPNEFDGAIRSAGNMQNPKVIALRPAVCRGFLQTDFVRGLNQVLEPRGLQIADVSIEKLMIAHANGRPLIDGIVWLIVSKRQAAGQ